MNDADATKTPPTLIDSHAHLADERILPDVDAVVARAREAGVRGIVAIATDADDARTVAELAERLPGVWATAGVHPHTAERADRTVLAAVREALEHPRVVAVGETGLDFFYDNAPREAQLRSFARHLEMAADAGLPVVVHSRDADEETRAAIRDAEGAVTGVLHCFAGGAALLDAALEAGWFVSFSGLVTFRDYDGEDLVRAVPPDRVLVETDAPYLAPVPKRGRTNEPAYVAHTAARVAEIRGEDAAELAAATVANAVRFFSLPEGWDGGDAEEAEAG